MRSTRAASAVARLNERSEDTHYIMARTSNELFILREQTGNGDRAVSEALALDDFVKFVNAMGPQVIRRVTKNDAAFAKQLLKKPAAE
jgi:hypothetical protein